MLLPGHAARMRQRSASPAKSDAGGADTPAEMSTKRKRDLPGSKDPPDASATPIELVVRRGALWRFNALRRKTADLPVKVLWDRRQGERRTGSDDTSKDRRNTDRRQAPPLTWALADFVVVGPSARSAKPKGTRRKKS